MKKNMALFLGGLGMLFLGTILIGCGQTSTTTATTTTASSSSSTSTTTTASSTTTTQAAGACTISGSLHRGTISSSSIKSSSAAIKVLAAAGDPIEDYSVVAVGKKDKIVYFSDDKTDSSGNFSISNLPANQSYYLEILDNENRLAAPVSFATEGNQVVTAVSPEGQAALTLGKIAYESEKGAAVPTIEPSANLDSTATANPKSGQPLVPVGADNFGKGSDSLFSGTYNPANRDGDKDGLPDFFDADNNGDLIVDEFDGLYTNEAIAAEGDKGGGGYEGYASVFVNLKIQYQDSDSFKNDYENKMVITMLAAPQASKLNQVSSIEASGPPYMSKAKIHRHEAGTYPDYYPANNSLWSADSYKLYLMTSEAINYTAFIKGLTPYNSATGIGDIKTGDVFRFKITYNDGTSEYFTKMINFIFTDIPRMISYSFDGGATWTTAPTTQEYSAGSPNAPTSEVTLRWSRPKDENENEIISGRYTFEYGPSSSNTEEDTVISAGSDTGITTSLEATDNLAGKLTAGDNFTLGICIRSEANDNSAQSIGFTRSW